MDLVARTDAERGCTELLLDSFMQGLVNKLFRQKWNMYGRKLHYGRRAIDLLILTLTLYVAFELKNTHQLTAAQQELRPIVGTIFALTWIVIIEELMVRDVRLPL